MTNQEKAAYLNKYRKAVNDIKIASEELQTWREIATRISPQYSGMPHGSDGSDKLQTAVLEIAELSEAIEQRVKEAKKLQAQVQQVIDGVEDNTLHTLLTYQYIHGKNLKEISILMCYDYRYIRKLNKKAHFAVQIKEDLERPLEDVV